MRRRRWLSWRSPTGDTRVYHPPCKAPPDHVEYGSHRLTKLGLIKQAGFKHALGRQTLEHSMLSSKVQPGEAAPSRSSLSVSDRVM